MKSSTQMDPLSEAHFIKPKKNGFATLLGISIGVFLWAFDNKPSRIVNYMYTPHSGQTYIPPGVPKISIDPNELNRNVSANWTAGSDSRHRQGHFLMGIEFDGAQFSLQNAADIVFRFYITGSSTRKLPNDGEITSGITVFRMAISR